MNGSEVRGVGLRSCLMNFEKICCAATPTSNKQWVETRVDGFLLVAQIGRKHGRPYRPEPSPSVSAKKSCARGALHSHTRIISPFLCILRGSDSKDCSHFSIRLCAASGTASSASSGMAWPSKAFCKRAEAVERCAFDQLECSPGAGRRVAERRLQRLATQLRAVQVALDRQQQSNVADRGERVNGCQSPSIYSVSLQRLATSTARAPRSLPSRSARPTPACRTPP